MLVVTEVSWKIFSQIARKKQLKKVTQKGEQSIIV